MEPMLVTIPMARSTLSLNAMIVEAEMHRLTSYGAGLVSGRAPMIIEKRLDEHCQFCKRSQRA
jgi:hypothetical protein